MLNPQMNRLNCDVTPDDASFLTEVERLRDYRNRVDGILPDVFWQCLCKRKSTACANGDQQTAKMVWCLETSGRIQDHFVSAFLSILDGEFKSAWDELERCEVELSFLDRHFSEEDDEFGMEHIRVHAGQLQELYPYTMGFSPGYVIEEMSCSICKEKFSLRSACGHRVGEIYDGEMCVREISKVKTLHISIVDNPAQKYSVIFPYGNNDRRLTLVRSVVDALKSPWHSWSYEKEERREYHPAYQGVEPDADCPCGSDLTYRSCCLNKETVFPHFQFSLEYGDDIPYQHFSEYDEDCPV